MKPTLIVLALLIAVGLVAGVVVPPATAEIVAPPLTNGAYTAVTPVRVIVLPASGASDAPEPTAASPSDGTAIPIIDVLGAGVLLITVGVAASILIASRRSPSPVRTDR